MLRKLSIVLSMAAALVFGLALSALQPALAATTVHHGHTTVHHTAHHTTVVHTSRHRSSHTVVRTGHGTHYVYGHSYGGNVYYGHNRRRWHGRWYAYGVGPCWVNVGGVWFWNVLACP